MNGAKYFVNRRKPIIRSFAHHVEHIELNSINGFIDLRDDFQFVVFILFGGITENIVDVIIIITSICNGIYSIFHTYYWGLKSLK